MFEIWYFHGTGDPFFGGDADDRRLFTNGSGFRFYRSRWQAERDGYNEVALFHLEKCGLQIGHALAPKGALVSAILMRGRAAA